MASTKTYSPSTTVCKPRTCPSCGTQECFERPRFFCGQLLTDKDLDAAQRYVIEKNKLHNRYLVGTGVVCGLAVRCDPCDGMVTVEPGYAIDCCGNDIVVCEPQKFDALDYIRRCLKREEEGCDGRIQAPPSRCDERAKEYCLVVSYNETHTRPVTAMVKGNGNGCNTSRCEPSRTSEVFRFDLVEAGDGRGDGGNDFWTRARACLRSFLQRSQSFFAEFKSAAATQDAQARHEALKNLFCRLKSDVLQLHREGPRVRCSLTDRLREIEDAFPWNPQEPQYGARVYNALFRLYSWLLQLTIDCLCDAVLVPCTQCCGDEGVLLACITVRDGKVEKICNTVRQQVLTGPALRHWLQPLYTHAGRLLEHLCCELNLGDTFDRLFRPRPTEPGTVPTVTVARAAARADAAGQGGEDGARSPEDETAEAVERAVARGASALRLAENYSAATLNSLRTANLLQLTDPQTITALDLYDLSAQAARAMLEERQITVTETHAATEAEAYSLGNLFAMAWVLTPQSSAELIVSPEGRVTGVRTR